MKRSDLKNLWRKYRNRKGKLPVDKYESMMCSIDELSKMLNHNGVVILDNSTILGSPDSELTLKFYLSLQYMRGCNIALSNSFDFALNYIVDNIKEMSDVLGGRENKLANNDFSLIGCRPSQTMASNDVVVFMDKDVTLLHRDDNHILHFHCPIWDDINECVEFINNNPRGGHQILVFTNNPEYVNYIKGVAEKDMLRVWYDSEKMFADEWFLDHKTMVDPEFEMSMMNPEYDKFKLLTYIGTNFPSKLRSYVRFDRKFVNQFVSKNDLELMI